MDLDPGTLGKSISNTEMKWHAGIWGDILLKNGCRKISNNELRMKYFLEFFSIFVALKFENSSNCSKLGKILIYDI